MLTRTEPADLDRLADGVHRACFWNLLVGNAVFFVAGIVFLVQAHGALPRQVAAIARVALTATAMVIGLAQAATSLAMELRRLRGLRPGAVAPLGLVVLAGCSLAFALCAAAWYLDALSDGGKHGPLGILGGAIVLLALAAAVAAAHTAWRLWMLPPDRP